MHDTSPAFVTPAAAPAWKRWLVFSPLARIVIFVALMAAFAFATVMLIRATGFHGKAALPWQNALVQMVVRALPALLAYLLLVRGIERRVPAELSLPKLLPQSVLGAAVGTALFSTVVGVLWLLGSYHVSGFSPRADWLSSLMLVGLGAGIGEEIMFRGVLFRIVEEGLGTWAALLMSAAFFGAVHGHNPGATVWSSAAIAIEAGLLFGLLYHVTRSLYLCMGVHAAWNFVQGTVYGIPVSGLKADGWLVSYRTGPHWLSGGAFGAEASVVALALCLLGSAALLWVARRRGSMLAPGWRRVR
jgi:membrane protease YdiL (CAAX protease family)